MSLKRVLETLAGLGLSQSDAKIYVFLAKRGPQRVRNLCTGLNMPKSFVYQCLSKLESKGTVSSTHERPAQFSAVPFERILDLLIKTKMKEAENVQRDKEKALSDWKRITGYEGLEK